MLKPDEQPSIRRHLVGVEPIQNALPMQRISAVRDRTRHVFKIQNRRRRYQVMADAAILAPLNRCRSL